MIYKNHIEIAQVVTSDKDPLPTIAVFDMETLKIKKVINDMNYIIDNFVPVNDAFLVTVASK